MQDCISGRQLSLCVGIFLWQMAATVGRKYLPVFLAYLVAGRRSQSWSYLNAIWLEGTKLLARYLDSAYKTTICGQTGPLNLPRSCAESQSVS